MSKAGEIRICGVSPSTVLDVQEACQPHTLSNSSPIDQYYSAAESITLVGKPDLLASHLILGRLLLLGHTSAAETFVRAILVGLLNTCPIAKTHAGSHLIPFASIQYYSDDEIPFGLFEGASLAGGAEVKKIIKKLTDLDLPNSGVLAAALAKFDAVCHLRHAAVHSHGGIGTANATALGVVSLGRRLSVDINLPRLHEVAMICRSFVQELNQFLFSATFSRWHKSGLLVRDYAIDRSSFIKLYSLFRSMQDPLSRNMRPKSAYHLLMR